MDIAVATLVAYGEVEVVDKAEQETSRVLVLYFGRGTV